MAGPPDIWFYHLQQQPLDRVLPILLEKSLERGWRAVVQSDDEERIRAIDRFLWTYSDASFLAHGAAHDGDAEMQQVYLTSGAENPNGASLRFLVDGADPLPALAGAYERLIVIFDGNDEALLQKARDQWRLLKQAGAAPSYWQQDEAGRWKKMA